MTLPTIRPTVLLAAISLVFMASCSAFKPAAGTSGNRDVSTRGSTNTSSSASANAIVNMAEDLVGTKYKYGGNTPREGFDCSGLSVWVYDRAADVQLPRTSSTQVGEGRRVRTNDAQLGDLVFFSRGGRVFHVAIVVDTAPGQLWVVHATTSRGVIREEILGNSYWAPKMSSVRRLL
ncbi:MAG: C40 family peptidase [Bacteroidota bacterium]